jgi:hypothetical protein
MSAQALSLLPKNQFLADLQQELVPIQLPIDSYIIAGSGTLAIRNIRKARDIDILVNDQAWKTLQTQHEVSGPRQNRILIGKVEIWNDWPMLDASVDEIVSHREIIDGFPFMSLPEAILTKKKMGRPKDLQDLIFINAFLAKEISQFS